MSLAGGTSLHTVLAAVDAELIVQNSIMKFQIMLIMSGTRVNVPASKVVQNGECVEERIGAGG